MTKKIRVLQSVGSLGIGGNEVFVMNFFRHINKDKFQVDFVVYDHSKMDFYDEIISQGSKVYICKTNFNNKYIDTLVKAIKVKKILQENNYDIIHCHSCSFLGIFMGAIGGWLSKKTKVISHSHNPGMPTNTVIDNIIRSVFKKYLSKITDLGFACSDLAAESKYTNKFIQSNKFSIINNAIDTKKFLFDTNVRSEVRDKYKIKDEFVIGNVGRLEEQKNQKFLLEIFSEFKKRGIPSKLMIVGDGSLKKDLTKKTIDMKLNDDVIFVGEVNDSSKYYQAMDLFVLTSIYEGFGFVNIEAQISGLPCIVSDVVPREVDISKDVQFISLDSNVEEWANQVQKCYEQVTTSTRKSRTTNDYDILCEVEKLAGYYSKLLA